MQGLSVSMTREPPKENLYSFYLREYLFDIIQKGFLWLCSFSCGHTVALTSERVNTLSGNGAHFPM